MTAVPVEVDEVSPLSGPRSGNTLLTIKGANFVNTGEIIVRFVNGSTQATATGVFVDSNHVMCITPVFPLETSCDIHVALNGQQFSNSSVSYLFTGMSCVLFCEDVYLSVCSCGACCDQHCSDQRPGERRHDVGSVRHEYYQHWNDCDPLYWI